MRHHRRVPGKAAPFEVEIEKLVFGGEGLGRHEGQVVFVPFTVPGDRVEVRPIERKRGFIRAVVTRLLAPGPGRSVPPCPHFGRCGGCQWQHVDYALQVETKRKILEELFQHHFPEARKLFISMKACPHPFGYRSRARMQLRDDGTGLKPGFFRYRSRAVEPIEACPLFRPALNEALERLRRECREKGLPPGATDLELACAGDGSWALAAGTGEPAAAELHPDKALLMPVGDFVYSVTAAVFFQANEFVVPELVQTVLGLAAKGNAALDLYAGVGLFTLPLAQRYERVVAVEGSPDAHRLAIKNASTAGAGNVECVCADVEDWMEAVGSLAPPAYDLILLDPPRTGAGSAVMKGLEMWAPETILYVSCDPQTLVRDLLHLPARDYQIDFVGGLDMFPETYHFETVVRLKRR